MLILSVGLDLENVASSTPVQPPGTLTSDLHNITDTHAFWKWFKSVLFDRAYNWLLLALLDMLYSGAIHISHWLIDWLTDGGGSDMSSCKIGLLSEALEQF